MEWLRIDYGYLLIGSMSYFLLGMLWYSPFFLGKQWIKAHQVSDDQIQKLKPTRLGFITAYLGSLAAAWLFRVLAVALNTHELRLAMTLALALTVGFQLIVFAGSSFFSPHTNKGVRLFLIDGGYHLVGMQFIAISLVILS